MSKHIKRQEVPIPEYIERLECPIPEHGSWPTIRGDQEVTRCGRYPGGELCAKELEIVRYVPEADLEALRAEVTRLREALADAERVICQHVPTRAAKRWQHRHRAVRNHAS